MKISRTLFLALTAAIGATPGCYADAPPPQPARPRPVVYQVPPSAYPPQSRPATTTYYYINSDGQRVAARVIRRRRRAAVGRVTADPAYRPAPPFVGGPSSEGSTSTTVAAADGVTPLSTPSSGEGEGCLDTGAGTIPECGNLKLEAGCPIRSFVLQKCNTYREILDPSVATVAVDCLGRMSSKQLCDASNTYNCGKQALSEACPDSELAQLCSIAATSCKTSATDCTALLSGLNDGAKQQVARCIATGCHAGLYSCVEGLTSSTDGGNH
jgi:hypothetical protein